MSIRTEHRIRCDFGLVYCNDEFTGEDGESIAALRRRASREGWISQSRGHDLCPDHAKWTVDDSRQMLADERERLMGRGPIRE